MTPNDILKQIQPAFFMEEELLISLKLFNKLADCEAYIFLTNQRLFVFNNAVDNDEIKFFQLNAFKEIENKDNENINIKMVDNEKLSFTYFELTGEIEKFLEKLEMVTMPIIRTNQEKEKYQEENKKIKKTRKVLIASLVLVLIGVVSFGTTVAYRSYVVSQEESTKAEQQAKKETEIKEMKSVINKMEKQIAYGKGFKKRLDSYTAYLEDLNKIIAIIDISDKTTEWNALATTINEKSITFKEIKISNEEMVDYGIYIGQKENYIQGKTKIITQNIEDILKNMLSGIDNQFTDSTSVMMITIKETGEDSIVLIDKLKGLIDTENELLEEKIIEFKAKIKGVK